MDVVAASHILHAFHSPLIRKCFSSNGWVEQLLEFYICCGPVLWHRAAAARPPSSPPRVWAGGLGLAFRSDRSWLLSVNSRILIYRELTKMRKAPHLSSGHGLRIRPVSPAGGQSGAHRNGQAQFSLCKIQTSP